MHKSNKEHQFKLTLNAWKRRFFFSQKSIFFFSFISVLRVRLRWTLEVFRQAAISAQWFEWIKWAMLSVSKWFRFYSKKKNPYFQQTYVRNGKSLAWPYICHFCSINTCRFALAMIRIQICFFFFSLNRFGTRDMVMENIFTLLCFTLILLLH